jgi:hypothetical protein
MTNESQHQIPNNIQSRSNISNDSLMKAYGVRSSRASCTEATTLAGTVFTTKLMSPSTSEAHSTSSSYPKKENTLRSSGNEDAYGIRDAVVTDALSSDDWDILAQYKTLLEHAGWLLWSFKDPLSANVLVSIGRDTQRLRY